MMNNVPTDMQKWVGIGMTIVFAMLAISIQWGVVSAKLTHLEQRLDDLIFEARAVREHYSDLERRVSFLEGAAEAEDK